ncbi:GNAT family N-acetyltransferase [Motilimonas eburnea]|uniref:GNAT family N-acetyltransferase n=1 Tax=Motilimonas eburnea TaxID=1737488 RepID=UPI001E5B63DE|nr:GNAT family N-acetyltransferase [Motilimonas eburnea]MCE2572561.1 GNAT family N-acetyltransferase [Motilimonas eburnea]
MTLHVRPYQQDDLAALYQICLLTADGGKDASHLFHDPDLVGHYYSAPYGVLEPQTCFVVTLNGQVCGYVVGTQDSSNFAKRCEQEWFGQWRQKYPLPDCPSTSLSDRLVSHIHQGYAPRPEYADYPAHLHINLLPQTQGHGVGRKIMKAFIDNLKQNRVTGLHLEVSAKNASAIAFYERMGFKPIATFEHSIGYGMKL